MEIVKKDNDHIYRMEDKGSSIVRIKREDYVNNVLQNLEANNNLYEKLDHDPTLEIKSKVLDFVSKLEDNSRMKEKTANYIKSKVENTGPGAYTEQPKTHKFKEDYPDLSKGFKSRGIISTVKTPTEALQDWLDFKINPAMRNLPSYLKDTKSLIQNISRLNEEGEVSEKTNLFSADFENMYGNMPVDISKAGIRKYHEDFLKDGNTGSEEPLTDEILTALDLCQQNNIFEFNGQLYRQTQGHGTGQKMAPPVACSGAGVIEQEFLSFPEVSSLLEEKFWWRYIDDIFGLTES